MPTCRRMALAQIHFNKAKNPPCAFTAFGHLPAAAEQSTLPIALEAGELRYGHH